MNSVVSSSDAFESGHPNAKDAKVPQRTQREQPVQGDFSREIIGAALEVQRVLGVGLLESAYGAALAVEFADQGLAFEREVPIPVTYKRREIGIGFCADFIVANSVIVELKATDGVMDVHRAQLLSYLRASGLRLGLLINFHAFPLVKGIHRIVNRL